MLLKRVLFSVLALSTSFASLPAHAGLPAEFQSLLDSPNSISMAEAIQKVKAAIKPNLYTIPNSTAPQANDRDGLNGCLVTLFDIEGDDAQLLVVVQPKEMQLSTRVDFMTPDDFNTKVEIRESDEGLELAYHRHGIDDEDNRTNEYGYIKISSDANVITISNSRRTETCRFQSAE
jgi:translation initiation factor 2B subunit (eIF-2B alpha/beta/delta family)